jgi:hypothetical protein
MRFRCVFLLFLLTAPEYQSFAVDQCSIASLKGGFGFAGTAWVPEQTQGWFARIAQANIRYDPMSHVGLATYDGQGNVQLRTRVQYRSEAAHFTTSVSGTYSVQADCTGGATIYFRNSEGATKLEWTFTIVNGGSEIETLESQPLQGSRPMYSLTFTQKRR